MPVIIVTFVTNINKTLPIPKFQTLLYFVCNFLLSPVKPLKTAERTIVFTLYRNLFL